MENTTDRRGTCPYVSPSRKDACVNNLLFSKIFGWLNMVNSGISSGSLFVGEFAGFSLFFLQHMWYKKKIFSSRRRASLKHVVNCGCSVIKHQAQFYVMLMCISLMNSRRERENIKLTISKSVETIS